MRPLKVVFTLAAPVVASPHLLHLDALFASVLVDEARAAGAEDPFAAQEQLPFDSEARNGRRVWKASALRFESAGNSIRPLVHRMDPEQFVRDMDVCRKFPESLSTRSGPFKQSQVWVPQIHATSAYAYCVGDLDEVQRLSSRVEYLGKRRAGGFGLVVAFDVIEDEAAHDQWQWRVMPWEPKDVAWPVAPGDLAYRPPYWKNENRTLAWQPVE